MNNPDQNNRPSGDQTPENTPQQPSDQPPVQGESGRKFRIPWKFVAGFLGWYLVMALFYGLMFGGIGTSASNEGLIYCSGPIFPVQVIALILLLIIKEQRVIGWGMLSAIGVNFLISLVLGLFNNALCFVPFFWPVE